MSYNRNLSSPRQNVPRQETTGNGRVISEVRCTVPITVFKPRAEHVLANGDVVDEREYLGSFRSSKGTLWLRLTASNSQKLSNGNYAKGQYGRILMFGNLVSHFVDLMVDTGRDYITVTAHCTMRTVENVDRNGTVHHNIEWQTYGFEYKGEFHTTKRGTVVVTRTNNAVVDDNEVRNMNDALTREGDMAYGREFRRPVREEQPQQGRGRNMDWNDDGRGQQRDLERQTYDNPRYTDGRSLATNRQLQRDERPQVSSNYRHNGRSRY